MNQKIEKGMYVKIVSANNLERFWVKVLQVKNNMVTGKVDNKLIHPELHKYDYGDKIKFPIDNIVDTRKV